MPAKKKSKGKPEPHRKYREIKLENLMHLSQTLVRDLYGYSYQTMAAWKKEKPEIVNSDDTWDLQQIVQWRENKAKQKAGDERQDLELEKLRKEVEFKDSQIQKNLRNMMDRTTHEQILASRAATLRQFLETAFRQNAHHFVGKSLDATRTTCDAFARAALDAFVGMVDNDNADH